MYHIHHLTTRTTRTTQSSISRLEQVVSIGQPSLTPQQNCKKSAKNREYTFIKNIREKTKYVKATNCVTNEDSYFSSMHATSKRTGINTGSVKRVCDKMYGCKTGISKNDGCKYKFEYIEKNKIPVNYTIKKTGDLRKKLTDEEKWKNKEYVCPNCGTIMKNGSNYKHNKTHE